MLNLEREEILRTFEGRVGHRFKDVGLLDQALAHRSYLNERGYSGQDNQRLEFLGDAVIGLVMSAYLVDQHPQHQEGKLSQLRAAVVSNKGLALLARRIDLGEFLLLGKGEVQDGGKEKDSILAGCLEALIGAIYLDAGMEGASCVFWKLWKDDIQGLLSQNIQRDFKSQLQIFTQENLCCVPDYRVLQEKGAAHQRVFEVELSINGRIHSLGYGKSKKEAEQEAAMTMLDRLSQEEQLV